MAWAVGDLVWCLVRGYPRWPGQVMDPETALKAVRNKGKAGQTLVSFFGDSSYGWFKNRDIESFEAAFETNSAPKSNKVRSHPVPAACKTHLLTNAAQLDPPHSAAKHDTETQACSRGI